MPKPDLLLTIALSKSVFLVVVQRTILLVRERPLRGTTAHVFLVLEGE